MTIGRENESDSSTRRGIKRRRLLGGAVAVAALGAMPGRSLLLAAPAAAQNATPVAPDFLALATVAIDLASEPATLDPALTYDPDGWSVVHSVYDAVVQYGADGELQPVLAESLEFSDSTTLEIRLRPGVTFHNGEPLTAKSIAFSIAHIQNPDTNSQIAGNFAVIESVEEIDELTARLTLSAPAPWLPAQMAAWLCLLPPEYAGDPANDFASNPVGTGPYRFVSWNRGAEIQLEVNSDYPADSPKGRPIAAAARYRFAPEPTTRVADLLSGTANLMRGVPVDQFEQVAQDALLLAQAVSGAAFVRIPTDIAPFNDVRVRQALNYAVDVDAIVAALLEGNGVRLANFYVPGGLGFDDALKPYPYDPDQARALLAEAGYAKGFETSLTTSTNERLDIAEAVAGQLADIGVTATVQMVETAAFNAAWKEPVNELRYISWRPLYDPYTLLNLLVSSQGFLSRYGNKAAQALIDAAATENDPAVRGQDYRDLGNVLRDEPAAIYLYQLTTFYGVSQELPFWTPRGDDFLLPMAVATE